MFTTPALATLKALKDRVNLDDRNRGAGARGLVLTLAGDPGLEGLELLPERTHLMQPKRSRSVGIKPSESFPAAA